MLSIQKKYSDFLQLVNDEISKTNLSFESTSVLAAALRNTELLIPVIGSFSAGKSTLINSFLSNKILPVGITPETALATEIRYSETEFIEAIKDDNTAIKFSIDAIEEVRNNAKDYKYIKLFVKNENIQKIAPLVLVDMPGYDSPLDLHNQAIMNYINKGVHFIVLTSVEEGTITKSMIRQLSDLQEYGRSFSFFISKANLRSDTEVEEIKDKIRDQMSEYFPSTKNIVSIGIEGGQNLANVLNEINPEKLFENLFNVELKNLYLKIIETINTSVYSLRTTEKENEEAIRELNKGIEKIIYKRDELLRGVKDKYSDVNVNKIIDAVGKELSDAINELTATALSGDQSSLSYQITEIVRHSLLYNTKIVLEETSNNIIDSFSFELKDLNSVFNSYSMTENSVEKITALTKELFTRANSGLNKLVEKRSSQSDSNKMYKTITTVLAIATTAVNPLLEVVIVFLPEIISFFLKKNHEDQVRNHLLSSVIPSIKRELRSKLPSTISEQINTLIKSVSEEYEELLQKKTDTIAKAEEEKRKNISTIQEEIDKYDTLKMN